MGMNVASLSAGRDPEALMDVNTTPLIDVMLVLLVMLIITIPKQLHSINLDMPSIDPVRAVQPVIHEVYVDFDGSVSWDGQLLPNAAAIEGRMHEVGAAADQPEVHIKPNKLADYAAVAAVMAAAQRQHVTRMVIVGNEQFAL
jgi:biopolymer transport protein ExbD